jgi:hypothetical protein
MQIQQFGFVFHYMDFNFLFQCGLWFRWCSAAAAALGAGLLKSDEHP